MAKAAKAGKSDRPNILVIFGDDIGMWNVGAYTHGMMGSTPNIDRISHEGIIFTDHYGQASCTAGRAAFLMGQVPVRTGMTTVGIPGSTRGIQKEDPTLAEVLNLGQRAGLDMDKVMSAISKGAAQRWQMDNRWQNMIAGKFDYGFAVNWMRKDLGIAMAEGKRWNAQMPVVALVDQFYQRIQERGGGRWDTSSLIQPLQKP